MNKYEVVKDIPIKGSIFSNIYNKIINMDEIGKQILENQFDQYNEEMILPNHEDILPVIIKNYYLDEYCKFCDIDQSKILLEKNECGVDNNEMLFCIFLASIGETVFINGSDDEHTKLLNNKKETLYDYDRNIYYFGAQIYLPENIDNLSSLQKEALNDYKPSMDLMNCSSSIESLLVPAIDKLELKPLTKISYNNLYESINSNNKSR